MPLNDFRGFYSQPGMMTNTGSYLTLLSGLPDTVPELCKIVQGLIMHRDWAPHMGVILDDERIQETNLRMVQRQLERILQMDDSPLNIKRDKEKRLIGTCRDFSTFVVALLRLKGIPARARCGFGAYFTPGCFEDHWVLEYWKEKEDRWVMVDAQLDSFQRAVLKLDFDPLDMPLGKFFIAGKAWQMCRQGIADPEKFGIFDMHGLWFIAGNVVRDMLSLNKLELLPWDIWPYMKFWQPGKDISAEDAKWLDTLAEIALGGNSRFQDVRSLFENDSRLKPPLDWHP